MSDNGNHQQSNSVERVYAEAIFQMAQESGRLAETVEELEQLEELLAAEPGAIRLFASKVLSTEERAGSLERVFKGKVSDLLYRFLSVVNQKDRMGDLPGILRAFSALYDEREGVVEVDAYLAQRMDDAEAAGIAERIGQVLGRKVVLHQYVDPSLVGGLKLRIGDEVIDGSVTAQLRILREKMITSGQEKARTQALKL